METRLEIKQNNWFRDGRISACWSRRKLCGQGEAELGLDPGKDAGEDTENNLLRLHCQKVVELRLKPRLSDSFQHLGS